MNKGNVPGVEKVLELFKAGKIGVEEAKEMLLSVFYEEASEFFLDAHREKRVGFPEVVLSEGKTAEQLLDIVRRLIRIKPLVFVSRIGDKKQSILEEGFKDYTIRKAGKLLAIRKEKSDPLVNGSVGIITAGTSDIEYAGECALYLEELGAEVVRFYDAGVSGPHRAALGLKRLKNVDLVIVLAGMDGMLPAIIGSITDLPIIGVPVPSGYGLGGDGEGALVTMLQSCVPGLLVVNIGNTLGAAAGAVRMLRAMRRSALGQDRNSEAGDK